MKINRFAAALSTCMVASAAGLFAFVPTSSAATASPAARHIAPPPQKPSIAERPQDSGDGYVCYDAYVQNTGWQGWVCEGDVAGTVGQSLRMEALAIVSYTTDGICADAQLQNIGWQGWACANDDDVLTVGTEGQSLRMEALRLAPNEGTVCADAQVQNIGWMGWICGSDITVGTVGRSLRMEAIEITV
jgi:uncharacterized protein YjdB